MNNNSYQPKKSDLVLGGQTPPPVSGAVMGGLEGVKIRLKSSVIELRVAALSDALNYGEAGLDLVIDALQDSVEEIQLSAARLLRKAENIKGKQALLKYDYRLFFTTFNHWNVEEFNYRCAIKNTVGTAYLVRNDDELKKLLLDPKRKSIEALKCEIEDEYWNRRKDFRSFVNVLVEASENLPNLKALFIGETSDYSLTRSKLYISNLRPLLKAYPKLEVLQVRGRLIDEDFLKPNLEIMQIRDRVNGSFIPVKSLKHSNLKTLIIEATDISDSNLAKICNLELPSLEYFELWLRRRDTGKDTIDTLAPILSGKSCPKLAYLGLLGSKFTNLIAQALVKSPIIERLEILNLSSGTLSNAGVLALLNCSAINRLHTLNVSENSLRPNMIQELSKLKCRVITDSQFRDRCS